MEELSKNWLTEGLIDFEYKKYILLAYLKKVRHFFKKNELYPFMSDLVFHYKNLKDIKDNKVLIHKAFPKRVSEADFKKLKLVYEKIVKDDDAMKEIEDILAYAIPKIKIALDEGKDIFEYVEANCEISEVGVSPLYKGEGYVFLEQPPKKETNIYRYQLTLFKNADERIRGLHVRYLGTNKIGISGSYEGEKLKLIKRFKDLPNPATYLVSSKVGFPFHETYMPVAKRLLVKHITLSHQ